LSNVKHLLDVNVLLALTQPSHLHHKLVMKWFGTPGLDWGLCAFSEAGFLRGSVNPKVGNLTIEDATDILEVLLQRPGFRFWPITSGWSSIVAPFIENVFGHQQITDAYLLGIAIQEDGVLVTLDKAIRSLAGPRYVRHVLVLEQPPGQK